MAIKDKKELMGYKEKPIQRMCSNCENFHSEFINNGYGYLEEKNIRCTFGNFSVKKTANCDEHKYKTN